MSYNNRDGRLMALDKTIEQLTQAIADAYNLLRIRPTMTYIEHQHFQEEHRHGATSVPALNCALCEVEFHPEPWEEVFRASRHQPEHTHHHIGFWSGCDPWSPHFAKRNSSYATTVFYYCTEECYDAAEEVINQFWKEGKRQWEEIQEAQRLLTQARVLVRKLQLPLK